MQARTAGNAILVITLGVITVSTALAAQSATQLAPFPTVSTSGRGETHTAPDRATVVVAVETRAGSASEAAASNATTTSAVLAALRASGLSSADLSTTGFTVRTDYMRADVIAANTSNGGPAKLAVTFVARNGVKVDVRALANLSKAIDAALAAGANSVGQIQFASSRMDEMRKEALAAAVQHARADAEAIARAAGGSLGSIVELTTLSGGPGMTFYNESGMGVAGGVSDSSVQIRGSSPTPLAAGDVPVVVTVTGRWRFVAGQ